MASLETRKPWMLVVVWLGFYVHACMASDCELNESDPNKVAYTISVDKRGQANFTTVQQAIDSIPPGNTKWIRIFIYHGAYQEKVEIPSNKGCIFIEGETSKSARVQTAITWGDCASTDTSPTFTASSDNVVLKNIIFKNAYKLSGEKGQPLKQAVAARLLGDKYAVINCTFMGLQDTLWDASGRHYFRNCYISGCIDFIWGYGQSIYEGCHLHVELEPVPEKESGCITAQGRQWESEENGFVFKGCTMSGGKALLGRAYGPYSRVIFYQCDLSDSVLPLGWDSWDRKGQEGKITYVEAQNKGAGADTSGRVPWLKKMSDDELNKFVSLSYIDQDGWIAKLPPAALA